MFDGFEITSLYTEIVRWVFVLLALYILLRTIMSLISTKNPSEVWAYMAIKTYRFDREGMAIGVDESSIPITHWENVIGRAGSCDISVLDSALSRNHGILTRNTKGQWEYRDLGSKNGSYLNDIKVGAGRTGRKIKNKNISLLKCGTFCITHLYKSAKRSNQTQKHLHLFRLNCIFVQT